MDSRQSEVPRGYSIALIVALIVQYALGMWINLFISFPAEANAGQLWEFAWGQKPIAAHIILAILILFGAIMLLVRTIRFKNRNLTIASSIGLLAILAAGGSGASFIPTQNNLYSYSMAIAFLIAILSYAWVFFSLHAASR